MADKAPEKAFGGEEFSSSNNQDRTNKAILDQLVYIDNFLGEDNDMNFDLSAFADESFVFADEGKPNNADINDMVNGEKDQNNPKDNDLNVMGTNLDANRFNELINKATEQNHDPQLNNLPRFPVPPGAKTSLQAAGLNQNQIDFLSALIAQHQLIQHMNQPEPAEPEPISQPKPISELVSTEYFANHEPSGRPMNIFYDQNPGSSNQIQSQNGIQSAQIESQNGIQNGQDQSAQNANENPNQTNQREINENESRRSSMNAPDISETELYKRQRNTAASARFRVKRKLKEQQMEEKIESLQEVIKSFEGKIKTLELENKLLKNIIIERGSEKSDHELSLFKEKILNGHN